MNGVCHASPPKVAYYKPDAEMQQRFCKNELDMKSCPRLHEYEDYLEALGKKTGLKRTKRK